MNLHSFFWEYGEKVPGYDVSVVNERETRAAAGILGMLGMIVIFVGIGYNHVIVAQVYLTFLFIDFTIRVITPKYAPSLLMGRFMVRNQVPEYVGGMQKRFAYTLGWLISLPLMWWFVLHWELTFYKVMLCVLCLLLTFLESAFSICVGCIIYKWITRQDPKHCPGGVCEVRTKAPIQMFSPLQAIIAATAAIGLVIGTYFFLAYEQPKTFFGEFLHEAVLTDAQLQAQKDAAFEKEMEAEFGDDF
ncbi:MAG: DUF4395 domain-containing protein [Sulfurimonas sp.]